jgi:hypothetical protein
MRLDARAFALTCGLVWGMGLRVLTWRIIALDGITTGPTFLSSTRHGYDHPS